MRKLTTLMSKLTQRIGAARRPKLIPPARIATISLFCDSRLSESSVARRTDMGSVQTMICGSLRRKTFSAGSMGAPSSTTRLARLRRSPLTKRLVKAPTPKARGPIISRMMYLSRRVGRSLKA